MSAIGPADRNLEILSVVARAIGPLRETVIFVGGCATGLLVTNVRAQPIRLTYDVDLVVQAVSRRAYHDVQKQFAALGFQHDTSDEAPICRWKKAEVTVDLMPTAEGILGFHNRWYELAVETAQPCLLPDGTHIKLITAPVFVATKFEAFKSRGKGDYFLSHDLEDIITIVDGRQTLLGEVRESPEELVDYLGCEFSALLADRNFIDAVPGHLSPDASSQRRVTQLTARIRELAALGGNGKTD